MKARGKRREGKDREKERERKKRQTERGKVFWRVICILHCSNL